MKGVEFLKMLHFRKQWLRATLVLFYSERLVLGVSATAKLISPT